MAGLAPQARPYAAWLRRLGAFCALLAPQAAHAGAWIEADGGRAITTLGYRQDGDLRTLETDVYLEQPFADGFAAVGRTFTFDDNFGGAGDEADAGVKARLWRGARSALALQASATWQSEPIEGCAEKGGELRALAGTASRSGRSFVNLEAGYRYSPSCPHVRYEATYGRRPSERWLLLGQAFVDDDVHFGETIKLQATAVRFSRAGRGVQLSVRMRVDGANVIEPTLIVGYWSAARRT